MNKTMIHDKDKHNTLNTILSSEVFSHSTKSQKLLKYLVDASMNHCDLNEIIIATEFFGKDKGFDPIEDASIRVYISQIRKKLEHYYLTEGKDDKIIIDIPKGHYTVRFREKSKTKEKNVKNLTLVILSIVCILLLTGGLFLLTNNIQLQKKLNIISPDDPIWTEFLNSKKPTMLVIGDYFFLYYHRQDDQRRINVRDPSINSPEEFKNYLEDHPDNENILHPLVHTYLRPNSLWGIVELMPILRTFEIPYTIKMASEVVWEDITSNNIIFLGTFKTMYIIKPMLENVNIEFSIYPFHLYLNDENNEEIKKFNHTMDFQTRKFVDYGLITKFNGPNNNTIMLITGFDQGGVIQASRMISKPEFFKMLLAYHNDPILKPLLFRLVIGVKGFQRADLSSKIEYLDIINE